MQENVPLKPGLYVTATPIGNLRDMTLRAIDTLKAADLILCEDTRHTAKLCAAYDIKTPRAPYHDHNGAKARPGILRQLREGARICLVSDAGTPLISDPGYKLVREARIEGIDVFPIPGANAAIAAISAAGMASDSFLFAGFLPSKKGARLDRLKSLAGIDATLIFYETATRLTDALDAMNEVLGDRDACVAREITKAFETFQPGTLSQLSEFYGTTPAKGEIVILVAPPTLVVASDEDIDAFLQDAITTMSVRDAAAEAALAFAIPKKIAYSRALSLQGKTK